MKASKLAWIISAIAVNNVLAISINFGTPYYGIMLIALLIALFKDRIKGLSIPMICLYISCAISILVNRVPAFFSPWGRFASFLILTLLLSPAIRSEYLLHFRAKAFRATQFLMQFVVLGSSIAYMLGLNFGRGGFSGITNHVMQISPISASVLLLCVHVIKNKMFSEKNIQRYFYYGLLFCSFICVLLPASRTAILGCLVSVLCYFVLITKFHVIKLLKILGVISLIMVPTYSYWSPFLNNVIEKTEGSINTGGILVSREDHWKTRIAEFEDSPFVGIGFSSVDINRAASTHDERTGIVETGTSWLSILSMTGIFGFLSFLALIFATFKNLIIIKNRNNKEFAYLAALLVFWFVHMFGEGYIFGAGGLLFFCIWLLFGAIDAYAWIENNEDTSSDNYEELDENYIKIWR